MKRMAGRLVWLILIAATVNGLAGLALAGLRLAGLISASWTLVLSPLWLPIALSSILEVILIHTIWTTTSSPPLETERLT